MNILQEIITKAYGENFDTQAIAPLNHLKDNQFLLELWHGPTLAFKDIALQVMPLLFAESVRLNNQKRIKNDQKPLSYLILAATSGDTGSAALYGYKNLKNISVIALYPKNRISRIQELQMTTQEGGNNEVFSIDSNFDEVQQNVKAVFTNKALSHMLFEKHNTILSSANSINWGRFLPQIVYHISSYIDLVNKHIIKLGDEIDIAVPTGNFGNILAAFYAKQMGLPIRKLICASNENNALALFLQTGMYDINNKTLVSTPSPSMDILVANNIERLLHLITQDTQQVAMWMKELGEKGKFVIDEKTKQLIQKTFHAGWVDNKKSLATIKKVFEETGKIIDPHTAVAQTIAEQYIQATKSDIPIVICATAHWAKFPKDVLKAITETIIPDDFFALQKIKKITGAKIPKRILQLENEPTKHKKELLLTKENLEKAIIEFIK